MAETKELDIEKAIKFGFRWLSDARLQRLIGIFFLSNLILSIVVTILLCILGAVIYALIPQSVHEYLIQHIQEITKEFIIEISFLAMIGIAFIVTYLFVISLAAAFVYNHFGWKDEPDFKSLMKKVFKALVCIYAIPVILVSAAIITFSLGIVTSFVQTNSSLFSTPLLVVAFVLFVLAGVSYAIANIVGQDYLLNFFLTAKVLEIDGRKTPFADITWTNFLTCIRLYIVEWIASFFNFVSPTMMKIQGAIIALSIFIILLANFISPYFYLLLVITILAYIASIVYNTVRFSFTSVVRILEADSAIQAVRKTWDYSRNYAFSIFLIFVITSIILVIISLILSLPETILNTLASYVPSLILLKAAAIGFGTIATFLTTILSYMVLVLIKLAMYTQIIDAVGKKQLEFKME